MIGIFLLALIIALCLHGLLSSKASDIAKDKGYDKQQWFHICFWLGPLGFVLVAAMPDLVMQARQAEANEYLKKMCYSNQASAEAMTQQEEEDVSAILPTL